MHASCVSHDMRAPLSAITHVVDAVLNIDGVSKKIVELLRPVRCTSKILNSQIYNLLDYNLLRKNNFKANFQRVDIKDLIEIIIEAMRPQAETRRNTIKVLMSQEIGNFIYLD
jgi:K+-sensing histidine kinase KdpD